MNAEDRVRLRHMVDEALRVQRFVAGKTRADFESDDLLAYAVVRAIEIIGEAASRLSPALREGTADIPWRNIIGMRNIIVHAYADISPALVWDVATLNLPPLILRLQSLLQEDKPDAR